MRLLTTVIPLDTNANPFKNNSSYPVFQAEHESELNCCDFYRYYITLRVESMVTGYGPC